MKTIPNFNKTVVICFYVILLMTASACHKEGPGGKSSVSGRVFHHSTPVPVCVVYIKYGATEFPGTDVSTYDASVTVDANAHYEFKDLRKGNYYLYGLGNDTINKYPVVKGGIGIKLKNNTASTTDIPVTE